MRENIADINEARQRQFLSSGKAIFQVSKLEKIQKSQQKSGIESQIKAINTLIRQRNEKQNSKALNDLLSNSYSMQNKPTETEIVEEKKNNKNLNSSQNLTPQEIKHKPIQPKQETSSIDLERSMQEWQMQYPQGQIPHSSLPNRYLFHQNQIASYENVTEDDSSAKILESINQSIQKQNDIITSLVTKSNQKKHPQASESHEKQEKKLKKLKKKLKKDFEGKEFSTNFADQAKGLLKLQEQKLLHSERSLKLPSLKKKWQEDIFANFANNYEKECFVKGTVGECDFFEKEINYNKSFKILDIGCGTGRHSIELTRRGYNVIGIDLSESLLQKAKEKATASGLTINFQKMDARNIIFKNEFDIALMICEGAFPLMETDEENFQILQGVNACLKLPGKLIMTTLNGWFPLFNSKEKFFQENNPDGYAQYSKGTFDLLSLRDYNITTVIDDEGKKKEISCNERYYMPSEMTWLLKSVGFKVIDIFGAKLGAFSRSDKLTTANFEMLIIASK